MWPGCWRLRCWDWLDGRDAQYTDPPFWWTAAGVSFLLHIRAPRTLKTSCYCCCFCAAAAPCKQQLTMPPCHASLFALPAAPSSSRTLHPWASTCARRPRCRTCWRSGSGGRGLGGLQGVYCAGFEDWVSLHLPRMVCAPPIRTPPSQHRLGSAPIVAFCHIAPCSKQHDFGSDIIPGAKELGCKVQAHLFKG